MITKKQLRLLRKINRKPRSIAWIKSSYHVSNPRDILGGMFTLIHVSDAHFPDDAIVSITKAGIIEIEQHQWFNLEYVIRNILVPIAISVFTTILLRSLGL